LGAVGIAQVTRIVLHNREVSKTSIQSGIADIKDKAKELA